MSFSLREVLGWLGDLPPAVPVTPACLPRSWDDFHACASEVLSSCPEEAAAIWESLRQESRKIQFQGNLQELCSARSRLASARGSPDAETNQATLRGSATFLRPRLLALLALLLPVAQL